MHSRLLTRHPSGLLRVVVLQCTTSGRLRACCWPRLRIATACLAGACRAATVRESVPRARGSTTTPSFVQEVCRVSPAGGAVPGCPAQTKASAPLASLDFETGLLLVRCGTVKGRHRNVIQPQVHAQLRAMMDGVVQHKSPNHGDLRHGHNRLSTGHQSPGR